MVAAGNELTEYVMSYFQDLFTSNAGNRINELIDKVVPRVSDDMNNSLLAEFTGVKLKLL